MRKLRILFLLRDFEVGGGQRFTVALMNALDRGRFEVCVAVYNDHGPLLTELAHDVQVISLNGSQGNAITFIPNLLYLSAKLKRIIRTVRPDVVAGINWFLNLTAAFIIKEIHRLNARLILINHSPVRELLFRSTFSNLLTPIKLWVTDRLFGRADRIVAINGEMNAELRKHLTLRDKDVVTIYNGISCESISQMAGQRADDIHVSAPYIIFVGRLEHEKGCDLLIEAFAGIAGRLPHSLLLVGAGGMRAHLEKMVDGSKLNGRVVFTGELSNPYSLMKRADFLVLPSRWDAFPYVLLEALSLGLPIVAMECEGSREILGNGDYGLLVQQGDNSRLADAILRFATIPALRDSFRSKSLSRAKEFSFDTMIRKYEELFGEV